MQHIEIFVNQRNETFHIHIDPPSAQLDKVTFLLDKSLNSLLIFLPSSCSSHREIYSKFNLWRTFGSSTEYDFIAFISDYHFMA